MAAGNDINNSLYKKNKEVVDCHILFCAEGLVACNSPTNHRTCPLDLLPISAAGLFSYPDRCNDNSFLLDFLFNIYSIPIYPEELEEESGERDVWASLLSLLPPRPGPG
ncbi:hypothetical protein ILYODFUR_033162 [Ilyodon furcidens]|uniref:Uncharacterized protein n=1 Tax=Ilyodon furcidens TaxID=33524 RepID=A0ABV0TRT4_9TELE